MINAKAGSLNAALLGAMHCFQAAARHLSFTLAAEELHLTQGAVSHRIKRLEQELGFTLFLRFNRRLQLTEEGAQLFAVLGESLHSLDVTIRDLRNRDLGGHLRLSAPPSLALSWLVPRLGAFQELHPRLSLHLETHSRLIDFLREEIDVAICYGDGVYPGLYTQLLMEESLQPVCSRQYAAEHQLFEYPENLRGCRFLHDADAWPQAGARAEWEYWCERTEQRDMNLENGHTFDLSEAAVRAALHGQGVAIGRLACVREAIDQGQLVTPFPQVVPAKQAYYVVCHPDRAGQPAIKALLSWLEQIPE